MKRIQTMPRLVALAALLVSGIASPVVEEEEWDEFGPQDQSKQPSGWDQYGNNSDGNHTTNVTTTTITTHTTNVTTTTITTTTEMPIKPHLHIAYFLSKVNKTNPNTGAHNEPPENLGCSLASVGQGAFFLNLQMTDGETCTKMPAVRGELQMYYTLHIDLASGNERNVTRLTAFCPDDSCQNCKVDRLPDKLDPDYPLGAMGNSVLEYDICQPTATYEAFSYFVRMGKGDQLKKDICVLKPEVPDNKFGITQVEYPDNSLCSETMPGAVIASSLRALEQDEDCDKNQFDGTHYKLVSTGKRLDGLIGCTQDQCQTRSCSSFNGFYGQCNGHGEVEGGNSHFKFYPTRENGMDVQAAEHNRSLPLCAGQKATPTPRHMTTASTTTATHAAAVKEKYKLPLIILGSVFGACVFSYGIFYVLRKRKLQRMSSYAALQDDPTF